jgi:RNA recognition motif-containing protein
VRHPYVVSDVVTHSPTEDYKANVIALDKPQEDQNIRGDAFKTLIVARLSYDATEQDLEREFGRFGPIERVCAPILQIL